MTAAQILAAMQQTGLSIRREGDDLIVTPPGRLTPAQRDYLRQHKVALLAALTPGTGSVARIELDDGRSFNLIQPGGDEASLRHVMERTYGDRVRSFTALEGIYQAMLEVRAWPR